MQITAGRPSNQSEKLGGEFLHVWKRDRNKDHGAILVEPTQQVLELAMWREELPYQSSKKKLVDDSEALPLHCHKVSLRAFEIQPKPQSHSSVNNSTYPSLVVQKLGPI